MKRKVVAYIRVSTEEQAKHGYSIEAQRQILKDYAGGHGLEIVREFVSPSPHTSLDVPSSTQCWDS